MIRRTTKITLEIAAGLVAATVLLLAVAVWRLSSDPVDLNFLTPRIEAALADPASGVTVRIGSTELVWAGWARTVDLHTRNVAIRDSEGSTIAVLPDIVIGFSLRALVQGTLAPSAVEVFGARLRLVRGEDGKIQLGAGPEPGTAADGESDFSRLLPSVIEQLESKPDPERPLSFLTELRILNGRISIQDRRSNLFWEAPGAVIELRRSESGITGEVGLAVDIRGTRATVVSDFTYDSASGRVKLQGGAANLHPAALAWLAPQLQMLTGLTTPLDASLTASGRADGTIESLRFDLRGGQGQLTIADRFAEPLQIAQVRLRGDFDRSAERLTLEAGELKLGTPQQPGPEVSITGSAASAADGSAGNLAGDLEVEATVTASNVPMGDLGQYWPLGVGDNSRTWVVDNITQGIAEEAIAHLALRLPGGSVDALEMRRMDGTLRYRDLEVHYMRPLPPVVDVSGVGTFDRTSMAIRPTGGRLGPLQVRAAAIDITGFDDEDQIIDIDLPVVGPLRAALEVLDHDRLALVRQLGIDTAAVNGTAAARVVFRFPLLAGLKLDDIEIQAEANLEQASIEKFLLGQDARDGSLALSLTKEGMEITGPLRLGDVGVELAWKEAFTDAAPYGTDLAAQIPKLDEAGRKRFGIDLAPYLDGPVSASIRMQTDHAGTSTLTTAVNLESATLAVAPLNWEKPVGESGEAYLTLRLASGRMVEMTDFNIDAGTLRAKGRGQFAEESRELVTLALDDFAIDETKVHDVTVRRQGEGYDIRIGGGVVDATSLISSRGDDKREAAAKDSKAVPAPLRTYTPLLLSARKLDRLVFGPDRYLETVDLDFDRGIGGWKRLALSGDVPKPLWSKSKPEPKTESDAAAGAEPATERAADHVAEPAPEPEAVPTVELPRTLRIDFGPDQLGSHKLSVSAEDMGGVLRALDLVDTVQRGRLDITGESDGPLPARPLKARVEARDYVLVEATILTKLLTVASLTGIVDLLQGEGITFTHLTGDVTLDDGVLSTDLLRAYGPALGLTAKGKLDFDESVADLEGTIVPAYTVNRILGGIPVLGQFLIGGEGEGFLAFIYRISGPLSEPEVKVNALSALAPGFLRGLFGLFDSSGKVDEENKPRALPERITR